MRLRFKRLSILTALLIAMSGCSHVAQQIGVGAESVTNQHKRNQNYEVAIVLVDGLTGTTIPNKPYQIVLENGEAIEGITNDKGEALHSKEELIGTFKLFLLPKVGEAICTCTLNEN